MSSSSQIVESWISSFCNLTGHEYFAEVSEDFIEDDFNLTGLSSQVPMYKEALEMILDIEPEDEDIAEESDDDEEEEAWTPEGVGYVRTKGEARRQRLVNDLNVIESSAELLYGLIHQRYITSRPGIGQMHEKYERSHFGACPRVHCNGAKVLPVGLSDTPGQETVKLFCASCLDAYTPPNSRFQTVDGAFFGTTFGCLFFMTYPDLQVATPRQLEPTSPSEAASDDDLETAGTNTVGSANYRANATTGSTIHQPSEINGVMTVNFAPGLGGGSFYEPRVYGFRVSEKSRAGPRMKWLRTKPDDARDLDEVARFEAAEADTEGGSDLDEDDDHAAQAVEAQQQVDRRKKAPIRRRRRVISEGSEEQAMNGLNGVG